ncbi:MAG: hypothetical protein R6W77_03515 [Trueperaceae bacterium]
MRTVQPSPASHAGHRPALLLVAVAILLPTLTACLGRTDSSSPIIAITEPKSGTTRSAVDLRIRGYAMDDAGVASIRVDGADLLQDALYASERGKQLVQFAFTKPNLTDGELTLVLEVTDVNGRTTTETYLLTLDATPPAVELTRVEGAGGGRVRVEGVASDNIRLSSIRINGVPIAFTPGREFAFSVLVDGVENGEVVVEDSAGNRTSRALP